MLVALSGGSDSVALALLLQDLAQNGDFHIAALAHLNHRLRPSAEDDQQFCVRFAEKLDVAIVVESADTRRYAAAEGLSLEDAARRLRYDFLQRTASAVGAERIAVGHTEDDQAETFLLKLMRGAGLTGLAGIYPRRGDVIRPMLETSRADLRKYLADRGQNWVEDETNEDLSNPRNRIRHRVFLELDAAARGSTRGALARAAALAREDTEWLDEQAQRGFDELATTVDDGLQLDAACLASLPPPILRRVLLLAMRARSGGREVGLEHVEAVTAVLQGICRGTDAPGARVELRRGKLVLVQQKPYAK